MTEETINITGEIRKAEEDCIRIKYYTLDGKKPEIRMCPGDLMIICNVLHDYAQMLREAAEISIGYEQGLYLCHVERCEKIRRKIETAMEYSTEAATEKCGKKHKYFGQEPLTKGSDVGEDALVLAMKQRRQKRAEPTAENKQEKNAEKDLKGQMSLEDFPEVMP